MNSKNGNRASKSGEKGSDLVPPVLREVTKLAAGVASVNTQGQGSATGNLRNKYALAPGHSLMDWIRLGSSGKDLTGVGSKAGQLSVTASELALHNKENDAWLCIRGRIYNVTAYLPFHPGGPEQLLRGAGQNATAMFEEVHPWVNFDQILSKCYVGKLRTYSEFDDDLFKSPKQNESPTTLKVTPATPSEDSITSTSGTEAIPLPKFDWIQKLDYITIFFYTGNFTNPLIEVIRINESTISVNLSYSQLVFENEITFNGKVSWPSQIKVSYETGKVEMNFRKFDGGVWTNFGVLKQKSRNQSNLLHEIRLKYKVINKRKINHNTVLIEMERTDGNKSVIPLGKHIQVYETIKGQEIVRCYTPVPVSLFSKFRQLNFTTDNVCLVVKKYPEGNVSRVLGDCLTGDTLTLSKPLGNFELERIEKRESFILLAAGTGITPFFSVIDFLLERRVRKCQRLRLLFFNRTSSDILFDNQLEELQSEESRFKIDNILSQPQSDWNGLKGHINRSLLEEIISEHLNDTTYIKKDIFFMICGPSIFTTLTQQILKDLQVEEDQIHFFLG